MASAGVIAGRRVSRHQAWDALFVVLSLTQAAVLLTLPSILVIALGLWWNANTIAHNFLHRPFFRSRALNRGYSMFLSVLLGVPQSVWRDRHLAHHVGRPWRPRIDAGIALDLAAVVVLWTTLAWSAPAFLLSTYLPGWIIGLTLCQLHGHYEHARGTTSHYGRIYNTLFFNDGYHVEHHARPGRHWSELANVPRARRGEQSVAAGAALARRGEPAESRTARAAVRGAPAIRAGVARACASTASPRPGRRAPRADRRRRAVSANGARRPPRDARGGDRDRRCRAGSSRRRAAVSWTSACRSRARRSMPRSDRQPIW